MILTLKSGNEGAGSGLRERVRDCAESVLGRLSRRVSHAAVSLREHRHTAGTMVHACTLRLRVAGRADILIESLRPDPDAAVAVAFRRARRELVVRRATPRRVTAPKVEGTPSLA